MKVTLFLSNLIIRFKILHDLYHILNQMKSEIPLYHKKYISKGKKSDHKYFALENRPAKELQFLPVFVAIF